MPTNAEQRAFVLETANRIAANILTSRTGFEALQDIAEAARALSKARYAALGVARPDGQGLKEFVTAGLTPEEIAVIGTTAAATVLILITKSPTSPPPANVMIKESANPVRAART